MDYKKVRSYLLSTGQPGFRFRQLQQAIAAGAGDWFAVRGWPAALIADIASRFPFLAYRSATTQKSADGTVKAALTLADGQVIETVLMQPKRGQFSVCVSCEVGCPMRCAFCATGKMGFIRVLTAEEITDQWLFWRNFSVTAGLPVPTHVVFMGMGEPFHNKEAVFKAITSLHDNFGLGWRKMSVSTSGIVPGIIAFAQAFPQVNLAISLHTATDTLRSELMPVNRAYPLPQLKQAIADYISLCRRQVMLEYLLLQGVNDRLADLAELLNWLSAFPKHLVHVNLIRYNPTGPFQAPDQKTVLHWKNTLDARGVSVSIRKNLGTDILGACGQLAIQSKNAAA